MQRLVTCYYALALLALNGRLYEESERCLARAERLDKRLRSGIMETRRNDGSHYTKDEHGRFTGSTSAGGSGGSGGGSAASGKSDWVEKDYAEMTDMKGKMPDADVRRWYDYHDRHIGEHIDMAKTFEEQAHQAHELRNTYKF